MSKIDWSATSAKELLEGFDGEIKAEFEAPASTTATTAKGGVFGFTSNSTDGRYRDAILAELARLHRIANVGESPDIDARIDELLCILEDVEGDE